jgi:hypothetical protein
MAASTKQSDREPARPQETDPLESFLRAVDTFVSQIGAEAAKAAPEGLQRVMIASTAESLAAQTARLTSYTRQTAAPLSAAQRVDLNRFLQVQDGEAQLDRVLTVAKQFFSFGFNGTTFLHWLNKHFEEIKKIIRAIIHLLAEIFHFNIPAWLDDLLLIIDELFNLLMSLLSEVYGLDFKTVARELSEQEVSFLRELAALESLQAASAGRRNAAQEEN